MIIKTNDGIKLSEIVEQSGISRSTVLRIIASLRDVLKMDVRSRAEYGESSNEGYWILNSGFLNEQAVLNQLQGCASLKNVEAVLKKN